jgi:hypothetical protein
MYPLKKEIKGSLIEKEQSAVERAINFSLFQDTYYKVRLPTQNRIRTEIQDVIWRSIVFERKIK